MKMIQLNAFENPKLTYLAFLRGLRQVQQENRVQSWLDEDNETYKKLLSEANGSYRRQQAEEITCSRSALKCWNRRRCIFKAAEC
jgi:hypothetical protein